MVQTPCSNPIDHNAYDTGAYRLHQLKEILCTLSLDLLCGRNNNIKAHLYSIRKSEMAGLATPWSFCDKVAC